MPTHHKIFKEVGIALNPLAQRAKEGKFAKKTIKQIGVTQEQRMKQNISGSYKHPWVLPESRFSVWVFRVLSSFA